MSGSPLTSSQLLKARCIATAATPLIGALCRTLTWHVEGAEHYDAIINSGRQPIIAFWHGRILTGLYHFRHRGIVVIVSQNFDGEWITRVLHRFGYRTARGSTSRGGVRALVQLRRELTAGHAVAFTVDGPRGPARVAQAGAAWLAGATGQPILPLHLEADRFWTTNSWDRAQVPKPFSRVALVIGEPIEVGAEGESATESARTKIERALEGLEARARRRVLGTESSASSRSSSE
jgi:lysophospholipid acyltransferase (LPLAT)-like uncharacterized protein